jgi:hypothetical protein
MGPILGFRGATDTTWTVTALLVTGDAKAPLLTLTGNGSAKAGAIRHLQLPHGVALTYEITCSRGPAASEVGYSFGEDRQGRFVVPGKGQPLRFAYTSCNGFSTTSAFKKVADPNERWRRLDEIHRSEPWHLLLMGGDQVYADEIWSLSELAVWREKTRDRRIKAGFNTVMRRQVERFYFDLYCRRWSQQPTAQVLASVPTLMMWDDHDIFDGWGSHLPEENQSDVFQGIFAVARDHFRVFQQMAGTTAEVPGVVEPNTGFTRLHLIDDVAIAALDMRSERTPHAVMGLATWNAVLRELDGLKNVKHLLVLSSIPVVHTDFSKVEQLLGVIPGRQEIEDDLRDHWHSPAHKGERLRLIHRLLKVAQAGARVTLLSGDVHVAALGVVESGRGGADGASASVINQLTSSAIVHPPPPGLMLYVLEQLTSAAEEIDRDLIARMLEFPGTARRLIGARNFLSLELDDKKRIWANWHVENEPRPYTKVIHPIS